MPFAAVAAVTAVIGLGLAVKGQRDQRKAQKQAQAANERSRRAQQKQQQLEQSRERRKQIREARALRARALNVGVAQGVGTTSTVVPGTTAGIQSQLASNLGFLSQSSANVGAINTALGEQSKALSDVATAGAVSSLGTTIFSNASTIGSIFSPGGGGGGSGSGGGGN